MEEKAVHVILGEEADSFVRRQPEKVRKKIAYNIRKVECGVLDKSILEKLTGSDIWELRTLYAGNCYRLFAFWDTRRRTLVVATHGIVKKTQKTPQKEIAKAEAIRKEYFEDNI